LVDRDIDQNRTGLHGGQHGAAYELRRRGARNEHRANDRIGARNFFGDGVARGIARHHAAFEHVVKLAETRERTIQHGDLRADACRDHGCVCANNTATDHHDLARRNARHAAKQDAAATGRLLERGRGRLYRQAAGDLTHRREEGEVASRVGDRFVRDRSDAGSHEALRLRGVCGEMEVGEQDLTGAELLPLLRLRLLHLHDHARLGENLGGVAGDGGAGGPVGGIGRADAVAGAGLDQNLVAVRHVFADGARHEADAVFAWLYFFRNADQHCCLLNGELLQEYRGASGVSVRSALDSGRIQQ
jgi:hypothetical protein